MNYFLIMNPGSGGGSKEKIKKILAFFHDNGLQFDYKLTDALDDAYTLSVTGNKLGYDVIVAVGGDGTINRVINGFYDTLGHRISNSKLGVIHTGSSPDLCKSYNVPLDSEQALNTILAGKCEKIPIGKITYTSVYDIEMEGLPLSKENERGHVQTGYFACCANIGLGASIARGANSGIRHYIGDIAGTFVSLIKSLLKYQPSNFTVSFDGQEQVLKNVYNIAVGKTTYIASGIKVNNLLSLGDSRFYTLLINDLRVANWAGVISKLYSGKRFTNNKTMSLQYASSIEVYGNNRNPELEFDGDPRGFLPCLIETARDPLDLICV
ncbi:diacylglycerol kinase family protein [Desulfosporosinus sp. BG]|uniref:diacylglycerol/lipid kinase family protein n=1 Tax=Desulfosporosinus sp. BG TaxID=1633135 RepID=UPI00083B4304|nr:diacylglycerol kinase family protein [Desulfosporosinus sp. BG]ODA42959.1 Transcription regulator (contains diacylglycerol kinase catalytic domain) [Desulfosporosinus sp. BG]